ncbi:MAG: hypothetical protein Q8P79_00785 [Nanoarchaeota archaeon]|nr:hypothetical protein [Nanoarchaeota archaeon]
MAEEIQIKKKTLTLFLIAAALVLVFIILYSFRPSVSVQEQTPDLKNLDLEAKFAFLSKANSNSCGGTFNFVDSLSDNQRIQGSCCSAMDFHRYEEQVNGLKKYSYIEKIPSDPYDVSASQARELLDYQKNIKLNEEQQEIYDMAMDMSMEGGPCCCKCWHWYAYEGLAKYLIIEKGFTAEQIAEVWDLSDACGGSGHIEGGGGHGH